MDMSDERGFAERLNGLMKERNMTVREAAKASGVAISTLQNWRAGQTPSNFMAIRKLANHLGTTLSFLLTGEHDESNGANSITEVLQDDGEMLRGIFQIEIRRLIPRPSRFNGGADS